MSVAPTRCAVVKDHRPRPQRFVVHHIIPKTCGGKTTAANTVSLCDSCHYSVHALLWRLAQGHELPDHVSPHEKALALAGYEGAVAAGTVAHIPNEGSATA